MAGISTRSRNAVTGKTVAAFEPALDYVVVKLPRFPFDKFPGAERGLGSQMKATGEVMAIERNFGAALNKALRGIEQAGAGWLSEHPDWRPSWTHSPRLIGHTDQPSGGKPRTLSRKPITMSMRQAHHVCERLSKGPLRSRCRTGR